MNQKYKYKIPIIKLITDSYAIIIGLGAILFPILFALKDGLKGSNILVFIFIMIAGIVIVPISLFISISEIQDFIKNRRNPSVVVDDESVLLPFEEDKQRVRLYFRDIKECKESYTSRKKKKSYFIYLSSKLDEDIDYRLYKTYMKAEDYEDMKALIINLHSGKDSTKKEKSRQRS